MPEDKDKLIKLIKDTIKQSFSTRITGDTPTDATQLTPKKYIDTKVLGGYININGVAQTPLPNGWVVTHTATGNYLITHNLGTKNYTVSATPETSGDPTHNVTFANIISYSTNDFKVNTINTTANIDIDMPFFFIVLKL